MIDKSSIQGRDDKVYQKNEWNEKGILEELQKRSLIKLRTRSGTDEAVGFRKYETRYLWSVGIFSTLENIVLGFRDENDSFLIKEIKYYTVDEILNLRIGWEPSAYINFCDDVFKFIKNSFHSVIERENIEIKYDGVRTIPKLELTFEVSNGFIEITGINSNNQYLTDTYIEEMSKFL